MTISQHAKDLLTKTVNIGSPCSGRPIIFVAYSLGGVLVKDAIVESRKFAQNPRARQVYDCCRAVFFFGIPHHSSSTAKLGRFLCNIVSAVPGSVSTYAEVLRRRGLSPDSKKLEIVTKDFIDVLDADVLEWRKRKRTVGFQSF